MFGSLKSLKDIFHQDIYSNLLSECISTNEVLEGIIKKIIVNYTGESYQEINKALTSNNPLVLKKVSYYLQFYLLSHTKKIKGIDFVKKQNGKLFRNILVDKKYMSIYKKNKILFFTHITFFKRRPSSTKKNVTFEFTLLQCNPLEGKPFFPGINVDSISKSKGEKY